MHRNGERRLVGVRLRLGGRSRAGVAHGVDLERAGFPSEGDAEPRRELLDAKAGARADEARKRGVVLDGPRILGEELPQQGARLDRPA